MYKDICLPLWCHTKDFHCPKNPLPWRSFFDVFWELMKTQGGRGICKDSPKEHKLLVWPKWANGVVGPNPSAHISMSLLLVATQLGVIEEPFETMSNAMNHPRISVNPDFLNVTFSCVLFYYFLLLEKSCCIREEARSLRLILCHCSIKSYSVMSKMVIGREGPDLIIWVVW